MFGLGGRNKLLCPCLNEGVHTSCLFGICLEEGGWTDLEVELVEAFGDILLSFPEAEGEV